VRVASVEVSPTSRQLSVGQTVQLVATAKDSVGNALAGRVVTWSTSASLVAVVSGSGLVTAVGAGPAAITATSEGQGAGAAVTVVNVPVASVQVGPAVATVFVGQTVQLAATPKDAGGNVLSGRAIAWSTGDPSVATVSQQGLVTGVAPGAATITAVSEGHAGIAVITVSTVRVASVEVSPTSRQLSVGQAVQLV